MATSDQLAVMDKPEVSAYDCSICHLQFVAPKIISCGHTFCQRCLETIDVKSDSTNLKLALQCPICQKTIGLPPSGTVGGFPPNFAIQLAMDKMKLHNYCSKHNKSQDLFCRSCKVCICADCFLEGHDFKTGPDGHEVTSSTTIANETVAQLKLVADRLQVSQFQNMILDIEKKENANKEIAENIIKKINKRREQLIEGIRLQAEELVKMVETVTEDKNQKLGKVKKETAKRYLAKMKISKTYLAHANEIMKHGLSQATFDKASVMLLRYEEIDKYEDGSWGSVNEDGDDKADNRKNETHNSKKETDKEEKTDPTETKRITDEEDTESMSTTSLRLEDFSNQMQYVENPKLDRNVKIGWIEFPQKEDDKEKDKYVKKLLPSFIINAMDKVYQSLNWK